MNKPNAQQTEASSADTDAYLVEFLENLQKTNPEEYKLFVDSLNQKAGNSPLQGPDGKILSEDGLHDNIERIEVTPDPKYVIKTKNLEDDSKYFINICISECVRNKHKHSQIVEGKEVEGLRLPMSIGEISTDKDKSGNICKIIDVILNPLVVEDAVKDRSGMERHELILMLLDRISNKYSIKLDHRYRFPRIAKNYKGEAIRTQFLRKDLVPVIEEVKETPKPKQLKKTKAKTAPLKSFELHLFARMESSSDLCKCDVTRAQVVLNGTEALRPFELTVFGKNLNGVTSDDITVEYSCRYVTVKCKGYHTESIALPFSVLPDMPMTLFSSANGVLEISMEVSSEEPEYIGPEPGSKPWLAARAMGTGSSSVTTENKSIKSVKMQKSAINRQDQASEVWAEDRFHKSDALSNYYLDQKKMEKEKREKEKAEREAGKDHILHDENGNPIKVEPMITEERVVDDEEDMDMMIL